MQSNDTRTQQWQETLEVATALRRRPGRDADRPPQAGELYLSRQTASFPVEWLVLGPAERGRVRVVPVDDYPLVGSRDVELPAPQMAGVAVARCGLEAIVRERTLEGQLCTGMLAEDVMERVRGKRAAVVEGAVEASLLEEVADGDVEYQRWVEGTLTGAVEALGRSALVVSISSWKLAQVARSRGPAVAATVAVAAMLLMVLGLGRMVWRLDGELEAAQGRVVELERAGGEQVARWEEEARLRVASEREVGRLEGLLGTAESTLTEKLAQLDALHQQLMQALDFGAAVNPRKLLFGGKARFDRDGQGRGETVVMQAGRSSLVFLEVEVVDAEPYLTYRLRLEPRKGGKSLAFEGLQREGSWLRVGLVGGEIPVGEYEVLIDGMGFGEPEELDERYRLTVEP